MTGLIVLAALAALLIWLIRRPGGGSGPGEGGPGGGARPTLDGSPYSGGVDTLADGS